MEKQRCGGGGGGGGSPPQTVAVIMFYERKAEANCTSVSAASPNKPNESDQTLGEFSAAYRRSFRRAGASADEAEDYRHLSMKTSDRGAIFVLGNISGHLKHKRRKQQLQKVSFLTYPTHARHAARSMFQP